MPYSPAQQSPLFELRPSRAAENVLADSKENPVRCDGPAGEREYLDRLIGPNGEKIIYERVGSFDKGPDGHILDGYDFAYESDEYKYFVFMDMYHPDCYESKPID